MDSEALAPVLRRLEIETGEDFTARSFSSRLRIQKSIYLLQAQGFSPSDRKYGFNNYIRGPYSPSLARDYYEIRETTDTSEGIEAESADDIPEPHLTHVVDAVNKGNDFLEAAATLHSVAKRNETTNEDLLVTFVENLKPELGTVLPEAHRFLEDRGLYPAFT